MIELSHFLAGIVRLIIQPLIGLLFALAIFLFSIGILIFLRSGNNPKERQKGRQKLLWGVIGIFIMVSAVSILAVVTATFCGTAFCPESSSSGGLGIPSNQNIISGTPGIPLPPP